MDFTRGDTTFFKGIGILAIVLHNYFHWYPGFAIENEIGFDPNNFQAFIGYLTSFQISKMFFALCGFLGHYGVQIFIVFSAYGLTKQYMLKPTRYFPFVISKLKKIYLLLTLAVVFSYAFYTIVGKESMLEEFWVKVILLFTSLSNLTMSTVYSMFSGPFWFFALIIQLYILYPLLLNIVKKYNPWLLLMSSYAIVYLLFFFVESLPINIGRINTNFATFGNILGHLPEVLLGVFMALKKPRMPKWALLIAVFVFVLSQMSIYFFPLSFLAMSIMLIFMLSWLRGISRGCVERIIMYIGMVSMALFVVNGPLRFLPFAYDRQYWSFGVFAIILVLLSHGMYLTYDFLRRKLHI